MNPIHPALAELARAAKEMPRNDVAPALARAVGSTSWLRPEHRVGDPTRTCATCFTSIPTATSS